MPWPDPDCRSAAIYERASRVLVGGSTRLQVWMEPFPVYASRGAGPVVTDVDGTERIDFTNNFASLIHGHAQPVVVAAVQAQAARGSCFALPTETEVELAELLCERIASFDQVRFCNTGSEAVMLALKAIRSATGRPKVAKVEGAYHGMYDYAEVSLDSSPENWGNAPRSVAFTAHTPAGVLDDTVVIPFNDVEQGERILRSNAGELAGVIVDPVPYMCGMIPATPEFLAMLRDVTREIGALLVFDEVIALRLDYAGAQARFGAKPDLTTIGKIVGGGYPVGAIGGREAVMRVFDQRHGKPLTPTSGTFTANPVTMSAGLATMKLLTREAYAWLEHLGSHARRVIGDAFSASGFPGQVTGMGGMFLLHVKNTPILDYRSNWRSPAEREQMAAVQNGLMRRGYVLAPTGAGFVSTVMEERHVEGLADALQETLAEMLHEPATA